jgi:glycosyltransferase involved in cell wall biosynthesis
MNSLDARSKILILSEIFWSEGGGAELATYLIANILRNAFNVTVVTGSKNPVILPGVRYVYEPLFSRREKFILWINTLRLAKTSRFEKLLRGSDIVYVPRLAFPAIPYAKGMGKKVVVHLHDYIPISYSAAVLASYEEHRHRITPDDLVLECWKGVEYCAGAALLWWLPRVASKWIARADKVVCVSKRQAEIISKLAPGLRSKIEVVYNPLPPELTSASLEKSLSDIPTFLYVGGDRYVKGFHILLLAMGELGKRGVKARVILADSYRQRSLKALKTLSEKYGNLEINVAGRIEHRELLSLHRGAWALVFPSILEEPLPYTVIESMLMGTMPVAARVGGVPEIVRGTYAERLLFTPGDVDELVDRMKAVLSLSHEELTDIGANLRESTLKRFDPCIIKKQLLNIFGWLTL